jgi:hypothetical protein
MHLKKEHQSELEWFQKIADEKLTAYLKIDSEVFTEHEITNTDLIPDYTRAKQQLTESAHNYKLPKKGSIMFKNEVTIPAYRKDKNDTIKSTVK